MSVTDTRPDGRPVHTRPPLLHRALCEVPELRAPALPGRLQLRRRRPAGRGLLGLVPRVVREPLRAEQEGSTQALTDIWKNVAPRKLGHASWCESDPGYAPERPGNRLVSPGSGPRGRTAASLDGASARTATAASSKSQSGD